MEQNARELQNNIKALEERLGPKEAKRLGIDLLKRIVARLDSFSGSCRGCAGYLHDLKDHVERLKQSNGQLDPNEWKEYKALIQRIIPHLQKNHKLMMEGYYIGIYMTFGVSIGMIFGMIIFDNLALGLSLGMSLGVAIGAFIDIAAKKKGKTI